MKKFALVDRIFTVDFDFRTEENPNAYVSLTLAVTDKTEQKIRDLNTRFSQIATEHRANLANVYTKKLEALVEAFGNQVNDIIALCDEPDSLLLDGILVYIAQAYREAKAKKLAGFLR